MTTFSDLYTAPRTADPTERLAAGVRILVDHNPRAAAAQLAADIGAEVLHEPTACEAAIRLRLDPSACDPVAALREAERLSRLVDHHDAEDDERLASGLERLRSVGRFAKPTEEDILVLEALAERLARHERIWANTEAQATARIAEQLQASQRVVIHPESMRAAAAEVRAAEDALRLARRAAEDGWPIGGPDDSTLSRAAAVQAKARPERRNEGVPSHAIPAAVLILSLGLAGAVAISGAPVKRGVALIPAGLAVVAAGVVAYRLRQRARRERAARRDAANTLARASVLADEGIRRSPLGQRRPEERDTRARELEAATRRLALARRAWESMAGEGADPAQVEIIVAGRDPQHSIGPVIATVAPAARAAASVMRRTRAAWRVSWAALGRPAPNLEAAPMVLANLRRMSSLTPDTIDLTSTAELDAAEAAVARLRARQRLTQLLSHWSLDELRAATQNQAKPPRTLVLVEPFRDLPARRRELLRRHLEQLPDTASVVLVLARTEDLPAPA